MSENIGKNEPEPRKGEILQKKLTENNRIISEHESIIRGSREFQEIEEELEKILTFGKKPTKKKKLQESPQHLEELLRRRNKLLSNAKNLAKEEDAFKENLRYIREELNFPFI